MISERKTLKIEHCGWGGEEPMESKIQEEEEGKRWVFLKEPSFAIHEWKAKPIIAFNS